jgi:hypothetical protein
MFSKWFQFCLLVFRCVQQIKPYFWSGQSFWYDAAICRWGRLTAGPGWKTSKLRGYPYYLPLTSKSHLDKSKCGKLKYTANLITHCAMFRSSKKWIYIWFWEKSKVDIIFLQPPGLMPTISQKLRYLGLFIMNTNNCNS